MCRPRRPELRLPASPESLETMRHYLRVWLEGLGADAEAAHDVVVACSEPRTEMFEVVGSADSGEVLVVVRDFGGRTPPRSRVS